MAIMLAEVYDALVEAGASEAKARAAAEEVASHNRGGSGLRSWPH